MIAVKTDNTKELPYFYIQQDFSQYRGLIKDNSTTLKSLYADGQELDVIIKWIKVHNEHAIPFMHGHCTWHGDMANFIFDNLY
jgi:hypothetical protein